MSEDTITSDPQIDIDFFSLSKKQRKMMMKNYLKNKKTPVYNSSGQLVVMENEYSKVRHKERGSLKVWLDRVSRSQETGEEIRKIKLENERNEQQNRIRGYNDVPDFGQSND